jgi:hypothetical protein
MATLYFTVNSKTKITPSKAVNPGNYYIKGLDSVSKYADVIHRFTPDSFRYSIGQLWMQYEDDTVVDFITGEAVNEHRMFDFAQTKLTAEHWQDRLTLTHGSARYLNGFT